MCDEYNDEQQIGRHGNINEGDELWPKAVLLLFCCCCCCCCSLILSETTSVGGAVKNPGPKEQIIKWDQKPGNHFPFFSHFLKQWLDPGICNLQEEQGSMETNQVNLENMMREWLRVKQGLWHESHASHVGLVMLGQFLYACGDLNMHGSWEVLPYWRRYSLIGGSVSLWGWALEVFSYAQAPPSTEEILLLAAWERPSSPGCLWNKMENSQLF